MQETVDSADIIDNVYKRHIDWLTTNVADLSNLLVATCGAWDLKTMLPNEIANKKLSHNKIYCKFINVKDEYNYFYKQKAKGMIEMLSYLKLTLDGKHHSGIDDTRNISKIMMKLISNGHHNFQINNVFIKK